MAARASGPRVEPDAAIRRDRQLLLAVLVVSLSAVLVGWLSVRQIEQWLLRHQASATAVHWATFLERNLDLKGIVAEGLVSAEDQRILDFASAAGNVLRYEVIRPDGVTALSSWAGDFGKRVDPQILQHVLASREPHVVLSDDIGFSGNPIVQTEAYVPVVGNGRIKGIIKVLVDMTEIAVAFRQAANFGLVGLGLLLTLIGVICGIFVHNNIRGRDLDLRQAVASRERILAAEEQVRALNRQLRMILDAAAEGIYGVDLHGRTTFINPAGAKMIGRDSSGLFDRDHHEVLHGNTVDDAQCPICAAIRTGEAQQIAEAAFRRCDGTPFPVEYTCAPITSERGKVSGAVVVFNDISERKRAEVMQYGRNRVLEELTAGSPLDQVLSVLASIVEESVPGSICSVLLLDPKTKQLRHGAAPSLPPFYTQAIDGLKIGPAVGSCGSAAYHGRRVVVADVMQHPFWAAFRELAGRAGLRACWSEPIGSRRKGVLGTFAIYYREPREPTLEDLELIENAARLAEIAITRKQSEAKMEQMALEDALTGLPNRTLFRIRLEDAINQAVRTKRLVGVMLLDLDHFKNVNDSLGHQAGDALLKRVSRRLLGCVRKSDTVARLGGDEFAIIVTNADELGGITHLAQRIVDAAAEPFALGKTEVHSGTSVGITVYPADPGDSDELLRNADLALYRAKEAGRGTWKIFNEEMNREAQDRNLMEADLRQAIDREELYLAYQPQVDLATGRIVGVEALLRWDHPVRGNIPPAKFIPIAEAARMIVPIEDWVIRTACAQVKAWQLGNFPGLTVSVNVSPLHFRQANFVNDLDRILQAVGLDPSGLEIEVTEGLAMDKEINAREILIRLKELGCSLAIDDFGTGYSSLNRLHHFPVDRLKIDKSFVHNIVSEGENSAISAAIIRLGHGLNIRVIAEGVETEDQLRFLAQQGCDEVQGYLFGVPMSAAAFEAFARQHDPVQVRALLGRHAAQRFALRQTG